MEAGKLRHRLLLQFYSESQSASGETLKGWNDGPTVWGSIGPMAGRELFTAQQVIPIVTHKIVMRGRTALSPRDRIIFSGRTFELEKVFNIDEQGEEVNAWALELPS